MKQRRVIKVGDRVRFEHYAFIGRMVGIVESVRHGGMMMVKTVSAPAGYVVTRRQIQAVIVKKKKVEHEEFWVNEYDDGYSLSSNKQTKEEADKAACKELRRALLRCRVIERIKC